MGNCCESQELQKPIITSSINKKSGNKSKKIEQNLHSLSQDKIEQKKKVSFNNDKERTKIFKYEDDIEDDEIYRERPILQQTPEFNDSQKLISNRISQEQKSTTMKNEHHAKKSNKKQLEKTIQKKSIKKFQIDEEDDDYPQNYSEQKHQDFDKELSKINHQTTNNNKAQFEIPEAKRPYQQLISIKDIQAQQQSEKYLKSSDQIQISIQSDDYNPNQEIVDDTKETSNIQNEELKMPIEQISEQPVPTTEQDQQIELLPQINEIYGPNIPKLEYIKIIQNLHYLQEIQEDSRESSHQMISHSKDSFSDLQHESKILKKMDSYFLKKQNSITINLEENERNSVSFVKDQPINLSNSLMTEKEHIQSEFQSSEIKISKPIDQKLIVNQATSLFRNFQNDIYEQQSQSLMLENVQQKII